MWVDLYYKPLHTQQTRPLVRKLRQKHVCLGLWGSCTANFLIRWLDQLKLNRMGTKAFLHWSPFGCLQEPMIRQELYCWKQICSEKGPKIKSDGWLMLLCGLSQVESNAEGSLHMISPKHFLDRISLTLTISQVGKTGYGSFGKHQSPPPCFHWMSASFVRLHLCPFARSFLQGPLLVCKGRWWELGAMATGLHPRRWPTESRRRSVSRSCCW